METEINRDLIKIKICGLSRPEDIAAVNKAMPDYIGLVFWKKSRRYVDDDTAGRLAGLLDKRILKAGVFVDDDPDHITGLIKRGIIDIAQLHGSEDEDYIKKLKDKAGCTVIKAFNINTPGAAHMIESSPADMVMIDPGKGDGRAFDWHAIDRPGRAFFLAGGLDAENVSEAIVSLRPWAVDVSSGVETGGVKDPEKIERFVDICRRSKADTRRL